MKAKNIKNLEIGKTYYKPNGTWNYKAGVLIRVLDNNKSVLLKDKKGKIFRTSISKLQEVPYKAVRGFKARERVKRETEQREKQKAMESLVPQSVQKKVKQLKRKNKAFATIENEKYVVKGYRNDLKFDTLQELETWVNLELDASVKFRQDILSQNYKFMKAKNEHGEYDYFEKLEFLFPHREIKCKVYYGGKEEILENRTLDKDVLCPDMKLVIREDQKLSKKA